MTFSTFRKIILVFVCMAFTVSAYATPITVINPSFEYPSGILDTPCPVSLGCTYTYGLPTGWAGSGSIGLFQPGSSFGNSAYFNYVPDGVAVAFSNGGLLSQTISDTVVEGFVYTLQVDWGNRADSFFDPFASVTLVIGDDNVFAAGITPTSGNWSTYTATYIGTANDAGKPITIVLDSLSHGESQGNWDNVRLDGYSRHEENSNVEVNSVVVQPVPELPSYFLMAMGLIGLAGMRRFGSARTV